MNFAKNNSGQIILTEGYMDAVSLHSVGITNAVASLGTALTENQANLIKKHCNEVVICYDSDTAGQNATQRAIPMLQKVGLQVKVVAVPNGKDPNEFVKANGENAPVLFRKLIDESEVAEEIKEDIQVNSNKEIRSDNLRAKLHIEMHEPRISGSSLGSADITVNDRFSFRVWVMPKHDGTGNYLLYPNYKNGKGQYSSYV